MDTYRDDYGAAREQVEALKHELEETKRSLEEARTLAKLHQDTARTLSGELKRSKPNAMRRPVLAGLLLGLVLGGSFGGIIGSERATDAAWNKQWDALNKVTKCTAELDRCMSACPDLKPQRRGYF